MPQMAPINWSCLFIMFLLTYLIFNMLNYFSYLLNPNSSSNNINNKISINKKINWKW